MAISAVIVSEDFVQIGTAGQLDDRKVGSLRLTSSELSPCRDIAIDVRDDAALATGVTTGTPDVRFLHVWHRERSKWMLVLMHFTPIVRAPSGPPPAGPTTSTVWPPGQTPDEQAILQAQRALNETFAGHCQLGEDRVHRSLEAEFPPWSAGVGRVVPRQQGAGPQQTMVRRPEHMAPHAKQVPHETVYGHEALHVGGGLESAHLALSLTCRLMRSSARLFSNCVVQCPTDGITRRWAAA